MNEIEKDRAHQIKAGELAENLIQYADNNWNMSKKDIIHSIEFYQTVKAMMKKYGCNAFTIECFELCSSMETWNRRFVPCMTHALLKDNGIPSACEGDINALLAMMLEMYISRKAIYMGNPNISPDDWNTLRIHHSVASLNMNGIDEKRTPYDIHSFTTAGFGVTLRHDFSKDIGQPVTIARFDPTATKVLLTNGKIIGGGGMKGIGCANHVKIRIPDGKTFWEEAQNFGHHLAMVFGNYVDEITKLGKIMNYEVIAVI
jgi:L-fucose isomerase-like protein